MNKIKSIVKMLSQRLINDSIKSKLIVFDQKFTKLIPDTKMRKITYYVVGGFLSFVVLIVLVGIITMPLSNTQRTEFFLNKPKINAASPIPQKELTDTQKNLLIIQGQIKNLKFPESIFNIPLIERDLTL